ncbi:hypothetical protein H2248_010136 [Termitomyces sp. 'cryptogamus']|nr:hypothetical protein H2248_010136 [Termitomyces sp. 'cryptogamus']
MTYLTFLRQYRNNALDSTEMSRAVEYLVREKAILRGTDVATTGGSPPHCHLHSYTPTPVLQPAAWQFQED